METTLFPISAENHIIFCIFATILFLIQFIRTKRWYQLVMAAAVPLSLLIYINPSNEYVYYGVGVMEGVLLLIALILNIVQSRKAAKEEKAKEAAEKAAAAETPETPAAETESEAAESSAANETEE